MINTIVAVIIQHFHFTLANYIFHAQFICFLYIGLKAAMRSLRKITKFLRKLYLVQSRLLEQIGNYVRSVKFDHVHGIYR